MRGKQSRTEGLAPAFTPLGMWAFSIGTSIGWGSFIVTCNTYLGKSGILGTVFGLLAGMVVTLVIAWNLQYMIRNRQGQHIVVWMILLVLVLFASMMWVSRATERAANQAVGMSAFVEGEDQCVLDVFSRADYLMYTHKNEYKASIAREERT